MKKLIKKSLIALMMVSSANAQEVKSYDEYLKFTNDYWAKGGGILIPTTIQVADIEMEQYKRQYNDYVWFKDNDTCSKSIYDVFSKRFNQHNCKKYYVLLKNKYKKIIKEKK